MQAGAGVDTFAPKSAASMFFSDRLLDGLSARHSNFMHAHACTRPTFLTFHNSSPGLPATRRATPRALRVVTYIQLNDAACGTTFWILPP